jgi:hypothetical protein
LRQYASAATFRPHDARFLLRLADIQHALALLELSQVLLCDVVLARALLEGILIMLAEVWLAGASAAAAPEGTLTIAMHFTPVPRWLDPAEGENIITPFLFLERCMTGYSSQCRPCARSRVWPNLAAVGIRMKMRAMERGTFMIAWREKKLGKCEFADKRQISTKELADYAIKHVDQLAKALNSEQEPQYFKGRDAEENVLAHW